MNHLFVLLMVCASSLCLAQNASKGKVLVFEKYSQEGSRNLYSFKDEAGLVFLADTIENRQEYKYDLSWPMYLGTSFRVVFADQPEKRNAQRIISLVYLKGPGTEGEDDEGDSED